MASTSEEREGPAIMWLPAELCEQVVDEIDLICGVIYLTRALRGQPHAERWSISWPRLALKHGQELFANVALCKQITWKGNSKQEWMKTSMRPAPETRIPADYTYGQMLRFPLLRPDSDLDGLPLSQDTILACLRKEQQGWWKDLVFKTKTRRNGTDRPSPTARARLALPNTNLLNYEQLLAQADVQQELSAIEARRIEDESERATRLGRSGAIRKLFIAVVEDNDFLPEVCMGCLSRNVVSQDIIDQVIELDFGMILCLDCLVKYARSKGVEIFNAHELCKFEAHGCFDDEGEKRWLNLISHPGYDTYITAQQADQVCSLRQGFSVDALRSLKFSPSILATNNAIYKFAALVAYRVLQLHRDPSFLWAYVEVDDSTFEFWSSVIRFAKRRIGRNFTNVETVMLNDPRVGHMAIEFWEEEFSLSLSLA